MEVFFFLTQQKFPYHGNPQFCFVLIFFVVFFLCTKALALSIQTKAESSNLLVPRAFSIEILRSTGNEAVKAPVETVT